MRSLQGRRKGDFLDGCGPMQAMREMIIEEQIMF